jgi:hypothetical protein
MHAAPGPRGIVDRLTVELSVGMTMIARMDRRGLAADPRFRHAEQAWSASRRMIARGERPGYRIAETGDGETFHIVELPWLGPIRAARAAALRRARDVIAAWLEVDPERFDVER